MGLWVNSAGRRANGQTPRALLGIHLHKMECPKQMLRAATLWEEGVPLEQLPCIFDNKHTRPKNSRKCRVSVVPMPTWQDAQFLMSRAKASKSGMGMWPGTSLLMSSSDASLADIILGGSSGGGGRGGEGEGERELEVSCCVLCAAVLCFL